jgi:hypothetical protein
MSSHSFHLAQRALCATEQLKAQPTTCQKSSPHCQMLWVLAASPFSCSMSLIAPGEGLLDLFLCRRRERSSRKVNALRMVL